MQYIERMFGTEFVPYANLPEGQIVVQLGVEKRIMRAGPIRWPLAGRSGKHSVIAWTAVHMNARTQDMQLHKMVVPVIFQSHWCIAYQVLRSQLLLNLSEY